MKTASTLFVLLAGCFIALIATTLFFQSVRAQSCFNQQQQPVPCTPAPDSKSKPKRSTNPAPPSTTPTPTAVATATPQPVVADTAACPNNSLSGPVSSPGAGQGAGFIPPWLFGGAGGLFMGLVLGASIGLLRPRAGPRSPIGSLAQSTQDGKGLFFGEGTYHKQGASLMNDDNVQRGPDDGFDWHLKPATPVNLGESGVDLPVPDADRAALQAIIAALGNQIRSLEAVLKSLLETLHKLLTDAPGDTPAIDHLNDQIAKVTDQLNKLLEELKGLGGSSR